MKKLVIALSIFLSSIALADDCVSEKNIFENGIALPGSNLMIHFDKHSRGYDVYIKSSESFKRYEVTNSDEYFAPLASSNNLGMCLSEDPMYGMVIQNGTLYLSRVLKVGSYEFSNAIIKFDLNSKKRSLISYPIKPINSVWLKAAANKLLVIKYSYSIDNNNWADALALVDTVAETSASITEQLHHNYHGKITTWYLSEDGQNFVYRNAKNSLHNYSILDKKDYVIESMLGFDVEALVNTFDANFSMGLILFAAKDTLGAVNMHSGSLNGQHSKLLLQNLPPEKYCKYGEGGSFNNFICLATAYVPFLTCPEKEWAAAFQIEADEAISVVGVQLKTGKIKKLLSAKRRAAQWHLLENACEQLQ